MSEPVATIPLPTFTFMLKDNSGAVFLRSGEKMVMPLFTSEENAALYKQRASLDCNIIRIEAASHLESYITNPPSRAPSTDFDFDIMVDPIDSTVGEYIVFKKQDILDALARHPRPELNLAIPAYLLMVSETEPFILPSPSGDIWPVFSTKENAGTFAAGADRTELAIAEIITASNLFSLMSGLRPATVTTVWANELIIDEHQVQFTDRLPIGEFLAALKSQADRENAGEN